MTSGYSQYSPYNEQKSSQPTNAINSANSTNNLDNSHTDSTSATQLHNGATCNGSELNGNANQNSSVDANEGSGDRLDLPHKTSSNIVNGLVGSSSGSGDAPDSGISGDIDLGVSSDEIDVSLNESHASLSNGVSNGLDEIDRAVMRPESRLPAVEVGKEDLKLILDSQSAESSPSKKVSLVYCYTSEEFLI